MRDKKGKSAKAKRGAKKAPGASRGASGNRKGKRGAKAAPETAATTAFTPALKVAVGIDPATETQPSAAAHREPEPPALAAPPVPPAAKGRSDAGAAGPQANGNSATPAGERRRWPDRHGQNAHGDSGDSGDAPPRVNKLLPTNAVHPTERRIKRRLHKNGAFLAAAAAVLLGVLILTNQSEPPEMADSERQLASRLPGGQDWQSDAGPDIGSVSEAPASVLSGSTGTREPPAAHENPPVEKQASVMARTRTPPAEKPDELNVGEVFEMQRILARLDLTDAEPNGVVGPDTISAIRDYQQIAGLPVDGEVSQTLLADMREVVKILDGKN